MSATVPTGLVPGVPFADVERVQAAAHLAKTVLPGPVGEFLYSELTEWCWHGHRYDARGWGLALAADLERRALARPGRAAR